MRKQELVKYNQLINVGKLSSSLTHEINTPLTNIKANLSMIKNNKNVKEEVATALMGVDQIDLLLRSFLRQIKNVQTKTVFSIREETSIALRLLEHKLRTYNITINTDIVDIRIYGSPVGFNQVLSNLIANSIDAYNQIGFLRHTNKKIKISAKKYSNNLIMKVIDYGRGIDQEDCDNIFIPFFTTKNIEKGTGLGLSISREIIEQQFCGKLDLISSKNPTVFRIILPFN